MISKTSNANLEAGRDFLFRMEFDLAIKKFQLAVKQDPITSASHQYLGEAYLGAGRFHEAKEALECAHELDPGSVEPLYFLARVFRESGQHDKAELNALEAFELDSEHEGACFELAHVFLHRKEENAAAALFAKALQRDREQYRIRPDIILILPQLYEKLGKFSRAKLCYQRALEEGFEDIEFQSGYSRMVEKTVVSVGFRT